MQIIVDSRPQRDRLLRFSYLKENPLPNGTTYIDRLISEVATPPPINVGEL